MRQNDAGRKHSQMIIIHATERSLEVSVRVSEHLFLFTQPAV